MTVSSTTSRNERNGNGATVAFTYTFRILDEDHISVYVDDVLKTITTHYTVSGVGDSGGGTVTFVSAPASGTGNVVFVRNVPLTQETDYVENDPFPAETHEEALDKLTMIVQQQQEQLGRAVTLSVTSTDEDITLPDPEADKLLGWNTAGTDLENKTITALGTLTLPVSIANGGTASATTSAARTALGLVIGTDVQAYDADTLKSDVTASLTAGYTTDGESAGTKSSGTFTPDPALGNMQYATNGGAHTLAPPTANCTMIIQYTNNGSAGTITTSGFTKVTGTAPTTTNGDDFFAFITKLNGFSHLAWQALQ